MMRETERKATIIERWRNQKDYDAKVINLVASQKQEHGIPDTVILTKGMSIWVEFKNPETKLKLNQEIKHRQFLRQGVKVWLVRFVSENEWIVENADLDLPCSIKFKRLGDGCRLLFDILVTLEKSRNKGGTGNFSMESETIIGGTN